MSIKLKPDISVIIYMKKPLPLYLSVDFVSKSKRVKILPDIDFEPRHKLGKLDLLFDCYPLT